MHDILINYCTQFVSLTEMDQELIRTSFHPLALKRKEFLLSGGKACDFIAFVYSGIIRHYHIKDGNEITCDITLAPSFITDFKSFTRKVPSAYNFQVLKDARLLVISKEDLLLLYQRSKAPETLSRLMAEQVAQRTIDIAMSLASDTPKERIANLLLQRPELFQQVPQRYLATLVGISPESLSRINARELRKP